MEYYNGLKTFKQSKYLAVYMPNHHRANKTNGSVYVHILQMEEKLGRELTKNEVVHHIDENKHNNSKENLMCFRTNNDHVSFHKGGELIENEDGSYSCKLISKKICPICGKEISYKAKLCVDCRKQNRRDNSSFKDITREQLKELIRSNSFVTIGKMFKCSDNNVRKKCKQFNLPYQSSVIKKISESEWESI